MEFGDHFFSASTPSVCPSLPSNMASTSEQKELELVEKVDFRILGVSNNEEKLQQLLKIYLPPLLLKAGSEHASVRNKVCMTRVLSRPRQHIPVRLPI